MKINQIILFVIIMSLCGCNNKARQTEKQGGHLNHTHDSNCTGHMDEALAKLPLPELVAINRNLSAQLRENFRSWSYKEPERWEFLADKFAEELIRTCPDAVSKKESIAQVFFTHLKQRDGIYNSDSKNKKNLMGRSSAEFKYNLSFLIGVEGYQKWQSISKDEIQKFKQLSDSLQRVIACMHVKSLKSQKTKP